MELSKKDELVILEGFFLLIDKNDDESFFIAMADGPLLSY